MGKEVEGFSRDVSSKLSQKERHAAQIHGLEFITGLTVLWRADPEGVSLPGRRDGRAPCLMSSGLRGCHIYGYERSDAEQRANSVAKR